MEASPVMPAPQRRAGCHSGALACVGVLLVAMILLVGGLPPLGSAGTARTFEWLTDVPVDDRFEAGEYLPKGAARARTVLLIGDSLSITVGRSLESRLAGQAAGIRFVRVGMESSGLARRDFFDWRHRLTELADTIRPDAVIIMLGTNDNQSLTVDGGGTAPFRSPAWRKEYARRMVQLFGAAKSSSHAPWIAWVGAPAMRDATLDADVRFINAQTNGICTRNHCNYLSTRQLLAGPDGGFTATLENDGDRAVNVRAPDGVHLLPRGAERIARMILDVLEAAGYK